MASALVELLIMLSQRLEESQQIRPWPPVCWLAFGQARSLPEGIEDFPFHGEVRRDIPAGRRDGGVPKIVSDDRDVHAGLQQGDGTAMAQNVGSNPPLLQGG